MPYRIPGLEVRIWKQMQGNVSLAIQAGGTYNPEKDDFEFIGLPYGPKARLILAHLNSVAIRTQSKTIDVEDSMSAFIKCIGLNLDGKTINEVKNQRRKIATSTLSLGYCDNENGRQVDLKIVKAFDLWFSKNEKQRVLWPINVQLSDDYFNILRIKFHASTLGRRLRAPVRKF